MQATAILDVGKTHVRVCAVDAHGAAFVAREFSNRVEPGPPYPHHDVEGLFDRILDGLEFLAQRYEIDAIVPVAHGATAALTAGEELVMPVLDYEFADVAEVSGYPAPEFSETLAPSLPAGLNLGRQLYWQSQAFPEPWKRVEHILTYPQFWAWRLTGVAASEVTSLGCHTQLWNPRAGAPSSLVDRLGWRALLPPRRNAFDVLAPLRPRLAERIGAGDGVAVLCGVHDSNASYWVHRSDREPPFAVLSTGTWVVALAAGAPLSRLRAEFDMLANVDVLGDPVACARFMGGREYATLAGVSPPTPRYDDLESVLRGGSLAIPSFAAQGGPFRNSAGRIEGSPPRDPGERAALASLYAALMSDYVLDLLSASGDLVIEGPFAANGMLCGILAAFRPDQPVFLSQDPTGTLSGARRLTCWPRRSSLRARLERCEPLSIGGLASYRDSWRASLPDAE